MKCPHCKKEINIGSLIRSVPSKARAKASAENGKKGGRPRGKKNKEPKKEG
jgi:hypothetical protein